MKRTIWYLARLCLVLWAGAVLALGDEEPKDDGPMQMGHEAYVSGDFKTAFSLWRPLAEQGAAQAQYYLSGLYARGEGVSKNPQTAHLWLVKAAGGGYAAAQFNLANEYFQGKDIEQDFTKARHWWQLAADQGLGKAAFNLGSLYYQGKGLDKDMNQALRWYRKAADLGSVEAKVVLAKLEDAGAISSIQGEREPVKAPERQASARTAPSSAARTSSQPASQASSQPPSQSQAIPRPPVTVGTPEESAAWIKQQPIGHYSIQLYAANNLPAIEVFVARFETQEPMAIFGFARDDKPFYAVIMGSYPTAAAAKAQANKLVGVSTWVRAFNSIRKLMVE